MNKYQGHSDQHFGCTTFSQHGDDLMLFNLLEFILPNLSVLNCVGPLWLDIGAHHPVTISNTKLLSSWGFTGVNVEANPLLLAEFLEKRPNDKNISTGVGPVSGDASFFMFGDNSGRNTFSSQEVDALRDEFEVQKSVVLKIQTINEVVDNYCGGCFPPLLLIDIEGLDFGVLSSADFETYGHPHIICVETRKSDTAKMSAMMERKGFFLYCRMGENLFFVNKNDKDKVY